MAQSRDRGTEGQGQSRDGGTPVPYGPQYFEFLYYVILSRQLSETADKTDAKFSASMAIFLSIYSIIAAWIGLVNHKFINLNEPVRKLVSSFWVAKGKPIELFVIGFPLAFALALWLFYFRADTILHKFKGVQLPPLKGSFAFFLLQTIVIGLLGAYAEVNAVVAVVSQLILLAVLEFAVRIYSRRRRN